jgi:hypothetical protein
MGNLDEWVACGRPEKCSHGCSDGTRLDGRNNGKDSEVTLARMKKNMLRQTRKRRNQGTVRGLILQLASVFCCKKQKKKNQKMTKTKKVLYGIILGKSNINKRGKKRHMFSSVDLI